jgi:hypothetical protein
MNIRLYAAALFLAPVCLLAEPTWKSVLEQNAIDGPGAEERKHAVSAHAKLKNWFVEKYSLAPESASEIAYDVIGSKKNAEIVEIIRLLDILLIEDQMRKEIEGRRDIASMILMRKKDFGAALTLISDTDALNRHIQAREELINKK